MNKRAEVLEVIASGIRQWTDGELSVNGPEDQERWDAMLAKFPDVRAAFVDRIRTGGSGGMAEIARLMNERIDQNLAAASAASWVCIGADGTMAEGIGPTPDDKFFKAPKLPSLRWFGIWRLHRAAGSLTPREASDAVV